jgi:hypothetical protein
MKFSLKDLMWSVTFASLGMGLLMAFLNDRYDRSFRILLLFLIFPIFGVAIGKLLQKTKALVSLILLAELFWVGVGMSFYALIH